MKPSTPKLAARAQIALSALALALVLLGTIVYTAAAGSQPPKRARSAASALSDQFALLRGASDPSTPAALVAAVGKAPASYGLDFAAARQSAANGSWLIPGAGWLCVATTDAQGLGMSCASAASAERGELAFGEREIQSGAEHIVGVAPDGYTRVDALAQGSSTLASAPVRENTYSMTVRNAARMTLERAPAGAGG